MRAPVRVGLPLPRAPRSAVLAVLALFVGVSVGVLGGVLGGVAVTGAGAAARENAAITGGEVVERLAPVGSFVLRPLVATGTVSVRGASGPDDSFLPPVVPLVASALGAALLAVLLLPSAALVVRGRAHAPRRDRAPPVRALVLP